MFVRNQVIFGYLYTVYNYVQCNMWLAVHLKLHSEQETRQVLSITFHLAKKKTLDFFHLECFWQHVPVFVTRHFLFSNRWINPTYWTTTHTYDTYYSTNSATWFHNINWMKRCRVDLSQRMEAVYGAFCICFGYAMH